VHHLALVRVVLGQQQLRQVHPRRCEGTPADERLPAARPPMARGQAQLGRTHAGLGKRSDAGVC